jgi:hypothetical protein
VVLISLIKGKPNVCFSLSMPPVRRDVAVSYDNGAGTLSIFGQSVTISALPSEMQDVWTAAIGGASSGYSPAGALRPAFGGDTVSSAVGAILDNQPTWRSAIAALLAPPEILQP